MVVMIINISHDFLSEDKRNIDYTLKMLIPANYVTKLIGQSNSILKQRAIWFAILSKDQEVLRSRYYQTSRKKIENASYQ